MKKKFVCDLGMSLLEMMIAMLLLTMFTGVVIAVLELTSRFAWEGRETNTATGDVLNEQPNGVLIEHQEIQIEFDKLVDVLSQPGISQDRLDGKVGNYRRIAYSDTSDPDKTCAPAGSNPLVYWQLSGPNLSFPPGYRVCLWKTGLTESPLNQLATSETPSWPKNNAKAGIYVLQALPNQISAAKLSTRRLFCRPTQYCYR